jgi:hypothetical protein
METRLLNSIQFRVFLSFKSVSVTMRTCFLFCFEKTQGIEINLYIVSTNTGFTIKLLINFKTNSKRTVQFLN